MLLLLLMLMLKLMMPQQSGSPADLRECRTPLRRSGRALAGGPFGAALNGGGALAAFAAAAARSTGVFGLAFTGMLAMLEPHHAGHVMI